MEGTIKYKISMVIGGQVVVKEIEAVSIEEVKKQLNKDLEKELKELVIRGVIKSKNEYYLFYSTKRTKRLAFIKGEN